MRSKTKSDKQGRRRADEFLTWLHDADLPRPTQAIIVLGGSFCPVHAGHVAALERGRAAAESSGMEVVAGYFAVAPDKHVCSKLRRRGEDLGHAFDVEARLRMCNAVASSIDWLQETTVEFGSANACGAAMVAQNHSPETSVVVVRGSDAGLLTTSHGETISSTLVRQEMRAGARAIGRLAASGVLLPVVVDLLQQLMTTPADSLLADTSNELANELVGAAAAGDDGAPAEHRDAAAAQALLEHSGEGTCGTGSGRRGRRGKGGRFETARLQAEASMNGAVGFGRQGAGASTKEQR